MMPVAAIFHFVDLTSKLLQKKGKLPTLYSEALQFFGVITLGTRHSFSGQHNLWGVESKYCCFHTPANFNQTGMPRHCFDDLWTCTRFSKQPDERPPNMTCEEHRWTLVEDFVEFINNKREQFSPHLPGHALMSQSLVGVGLEETGSMRVFQCMLQLTANRKMDAKSRMRVMV